MLLQLAKNSQLGNVYVTEDNFTLRAGQAIAVPEEAAKRIMTRYPNDIALVGEILDKEEPKVTIQLLQDTMLTTPLEECGLSIERGQVIEVPQTVAETFLIKYPKEFIVVEKMQSVDLKESFTEEKSTRITIVMPAYNQAQYIGRAIDSLLAQTYKNFKLVIVDDCSTDNTVEVIQKYTDPRIVFLQRGKNGGTGAALNDGFEHAEGDYGTWFSSDNWAEPDYLLALKIALDRNQDKVLAYGNCNTLDLSGNLRPLYTGKEFDREKLYTECYLGICFLFRLSIKAACGKYDLRPCEDYDMALKMVELGDFMLVPMNMGTWRDHKESVTHRVNMPGKWENHFRCIRDAKERRAKKNNEMFVILKDKPSTKLKVAHIHPWWDAAGVGIQHCEFISDKTDISIRHIMGGNTCLAHNEDLIIGRDNQEIDRVLREADILHFNTYSWNENKNLYTGMPDFRFMKYLNGKKVIFHLHGGEWVFRPKKLQQMVGNIHLASCSPLITQFYEGMKWMPNIMNITDRLHTPIKRDNELVRFVYSVNYLYNKGKDAVDATFDWMKKFNYKFEYEAWVRKYNLRECLEKRNEFDVTIDQMTQGFIGMVGWEAMSQGQAVLARIDPMAEMAYENFGPGLPVINVCGIEGLAHAVNKLITDKQYLWDCQIASRQWMEKYYTVERLVGMWRAFYEEVANSNMTVNVPEYLFVSGELC